MFQAARYLIPALLAIAAATLVSASCGSSQPASPPKMRSPSHDYREAPRGGDDQVLGAHEQQPGDWVEGTVTNRHLGPGWELEDGKVVPRPEQRNAGGSTEPTISIGASPTPGDAGVTEPETPDPRPGQPR